MRLALLVPVLLSLAAPAYADGVRESRYSPASPVQAAASAAAAARYDGPMLSWASRPAASVAVAVTAPAAPVRQAPTPPPTWTRYQPVAAVAPPPARPTPAAPAKPLPTSLYAAPTPPAPPPRQVAANTAPPAMPPGVTGARFYSVDRDAGLTPDPIPAVGPDNRVLITASAATPPAEDAAPVHGSADWLAAGVDGDDQASDRRAKTRNQDQ